MISLSSSPSLDAVLVSLSTADATTAEDRRVVNEAYCVVREDIMLRHADCYDCRCHRVSASYC